MSDIRGRGGQRGRGGGRRGGGGRGGYQGGGGDGGRGGSHSGRGNSPARGGDRGGTRGGPPRGGGGGPGRGMPFRGPPPGSGSGGIFREGAPVPAPDASITALENQLVTVTKNHTFDLGDNGAKVPGRRGYGTKGTPITLRTNYFRINTAFEQKLDADQTWYRYDVELSAELSKQKRRRLFDLIVKQPKFAGILWASDYAKIIVTTKQLDLENGEWKQKVLVPAEKTDQQPGQSDELPDFVRQAQARNRVEFRLISTGSFTTQHMIEYLRSATPGGQYAAAGDVIQLFNIIMCKPPNAAASITPADNNRFYPYEGHVGMERYDLGGGLQAMRGYYSSVRPAVGRLLLNLNVTAGAFYKPLPIIQLMAEFHGNKVGEEAFLRMVKVKAVYTKDGQKQPFMTKIKTIVGFARAPRFGNADQVKFKYRTSNQPNAPEREVMVAQYFKQHHGITLKQPGLPVFNVGTRADPQYLPPELCTVLPGQPYNRLLGGDQTSEMLKFAARFPNLNAMSIAGTPQVPGNGVKLFRLRDATDPQTSSVQPWGFGVDVSDMLTVPGRRLNAPQVQYGNKKENPRNGSWNCANQRFARPGTIGKWQVLVINRKGPRGNALIENPTGDMKAPEPLFQELERYLHAYGLRLGARSRTQTLSLEQLTPENRAPNNRALDSAYGNAKAQGVKFLLIVLPEADKWLYARIKFYGDINHGLHTICAVGNKMQKPVGQGMYMGNLALKFNIKGGGVNHTVLNALTAPLNNNTMLMGIDVTHPSPGSTEGAPSIACIVGSTDEHLTQWPGSVRAQTGRQEMVDGLDEMVVERLRLWRKKNQNRLPDKIILYRDGVSEGQYDQVLLRELPSFVKAFEKMYGDAKKHPKMAVIVVGKRHHTRFYPTREEDADVRVDQRTSQKKGSWNPLPGTIVDRHIGSKILGEFWLQAHQGLQGTARPAHYVILKDDIGFEADQLQTFTHNLCYLFNRATKAVSICPPAYYADLLCERGRAYLFSTLAESHGTESGASDAGAPDWTNGVHPDLAESTWYI